MNEKNWLLSLHLCQLVSLLIPIGGIIAALVIWLMKRAECEAINIQGKDILNFQLTLFGGLMLITLSSLLLVIGIGPMGGSVVSFALFASLAHSVLSVFFPVRAAIQVSEGKSPVYPAIKVIK